MVKVFSFCLYGPPNPRYYPIPMTQNIELIQKHFPGWKVYLYVSPDVDSEFLQQISQYPNVVLKRTGKLGTINRLERLFAIDEPEVETMFVRDADSRVHWKDRWAINDFLSKPRFIAHIIRDNKDHASKILAGLWGIHKTARIHIRALYEAFLKNPKDLFFGEDGIDQSFLGSYLYPIIKSRLLLHYSHKHVVIGENGVECPFEYNDNCHCGKVDGPEFVDGNFRIVSQPGRRILVNGRFKL
jgi:hypothetical protein